MRELTCAEVAGLSAELAFGIADARERAAAVAHLEHCALCRAELRTASDAADELVALVPEVEPPAGFESRVIASIPRQGTRSSLRRTMRRRPYLAVAAAVVAAALALGGWLAAEASSPSGVSTGSGVSTAALVSGSRHVGEIVVVKGSTPWMSMALQSSLGSAVVRCEVKGDNGGWVTVGTFSVYDGYGYWAASLPKADSSVTTARLVMPDGKVVATADLTSSAAGQDT